MLSLLMKIMGNKILTVVTFCVILAVIAVVAFRGCGQRRDSIDAHLSQTLGANVNEKVIYDPKNKVLTRIYRRDSGRNGSISSSDEPIVKRETGVREAVIEVDKDGKTIVFTRTKGFLFEPGLIVAIGDAPRLGVNFQFAYWRYWGANVGLTGRLKGSTDPRIHVGVTYNVYSNTNLFVGLDHKKQMMAGITVQF